MKRFALIFLSVYYTSCGLIARKGYGAKKQQIETKETITHWLNKNGLPSQNIFSLPPEHYFELFLGLPQAPLVFDNTTGNLLAIGFSNGKYCPKSVDKSFSSLLPYQLLKEKPDSFLISEVTTIPPGSSLKDRSQFAVTKDTLRLHLPEIEKSILTLNGKPAAKIAKPGDDYTLILPFALFFGDKLQLKDLKKYYLSAITNRFAKINIVFLNLDKQQWWGEEWNKKINIKY
jgi:hypothetical protein